MSDQLEVGQWGLFAGPEGKQLVILDGEPCGPVSARKLLQEIPRRLLLDTPRVADATNKDRGDTTEAIRVAGMNLRVETRQIISPWSQTVVGVFAGVFAAEEETPTTPLVGSWEWVVSMDADNNITGRRTFWNHELFELYEVDQAATQQASGYWEVDVWASELIVEGDQLRFFSSLRDGYWDNWAGVRCATFGAIAGYGTNERRPLHLRLVAQKGQMSTPESLIFQGFSYQVPEVFHDRALAEEYPTDNALNSFMTLVADPIAIVDPFSLEVLMSTPAWRREDFGQARGLKEVLAESPDDVRHFLEEVADAGPTPIDRDVLVHTDAGTQSHTVSVLGLDRGPARDALVIVRVHN